MTAKVRQISLNTKKTTKNLVLSQNIITFAPLFTKGRLAQLV